MKTSTKNIAATMQKLLLDGLELRSQIKLAHWNLKDPNFIALHKHLDEVVKIVDIGIDELAERVRQLGPSVETDTSVVARKASLDTFPKGLVGAKTACGALVSAMKTVSASLTEAIEEADEAGDPVSADLLTKINGEIDLQRWLIESHIPA